MALHGRAPALWESPPLRDHCGEHGLRSADSRTELCYLTGGFRNGDIERPGLWDTCLPPCHPHRPCGPCQGPFAAPEAHLSRPTTAFLQTLNNSAASSRASERYLLGVAHCREWDQETDQAGGSSPSAWPGMHRTRESVIYWEVSLWAASTCYFHVYEITPHGERESNSRSE